MDTKTIKVYFFFIHFNFLIISREFTLKKHYGMALTENHQNQIER